MRISGILLSLVVLAGTTTMSLADGIPKVVQSRDAGAVSRHSEKLASEKSAVIGNAGSGTDFEDGEVSQSDNDEDSGFTTGTGSESDSPSPSILGSAVPSVTETPCLECTWVDALDECTGVTRQVLILASGFLGQTVQCHVEESTCQVDRQCQEILGQTVCTCSDQICYVYAPGCSA